MQSSTQVRHVSVSLQGTLNPGERRQLKAIPQLPFRGQRLVIAVRPLDLIIHGFYIGNRTQLVVGAGTIPPEMFDQNAVATKLDMDTATPGQEIALDVESTQGGRIAAMLFGVTAGEGDGQAFETFEEKEPLVEEAAAALKWEDERYEPGVTLEELEALKR